MFSNSADIDFSKYATDMKTLEDSRKEALDFFKKEESVTGFGVGFNLTLPSGEEKVVSHYILNYENQEAIDELMGNLIQNGKCAKITDRIYSYKPKSSSREVLLVAEQCWVFFS